MLLFKGRAIAANKNCKKILMVSNVSISLCLACKIPRGILRGCPRKNGKHNFSTFTDFLIIVQFWFLLFYPRALRGLSMTLCTCTYLGITCCMDYSIVFDHEEDNSTDRNCIDPGDLKQNQLLFDIDDNNAAGLMCVDFNRA